MSGFGCCALCHKQVWFAECWYVHSNLPPPSIKHWLQNRDITPTFFLQRSRAWAGTRKPHRTHTPLSAPLEMHLLWVTWDKQLSSAAPSTSQCNDRAGSLSVAASQLHSPQLHFIFQGPKMVRLCMSPVTVCCTAVDRLGSGMTGIKTYY